MATYDNLLAGVPTDLWINGEWKKSSDGARFDVIDPATERSIASVASASIDDARSAVSAANGAFAAWAMRKPRERGEILRKAYELILRDAERLAKLITIENGKALADSRGTELCRGQDRFPDGRGQNDRAKKCLGIKIIITRFINDPHEPLLLCGGIAKHNVELSPLERGRVSLVVDADGQL